MSMSVLLFLSSLSCILLWLVLWNAQGHVIILCVKGEGGVGMEDGAKEGMYGKELVQAEEVG